MDVYGILEAETNISHPFLFRWVYIKMRNRGLPQLENHYCDFSRYEE